jgi:hypothetical protein
MRRLINILGALVLVTLLVLRRMFDAVLDERSRPGGDRRHARGLRAVLAPAAVVLGAFLVLAIWALIDAGYCVVAIVLVVHLAFLLEVAWRRRTTDIE